MKKFICVIAIVAASFYMTAVERMFGINFRTLSMDMTSKEYDSDWYSYYSNGTSVPLGTFPTKSEFDFETSFGMNIFSMTHLWETKKYPEDKQVISFGIGIYSDFSINWMKTFKYNYQTTDGSGYKAKEREFNYAKRYWELASGPEFYINIKNRDYLYFVPAFKYSRLIIEFDSGNWWVINNFGMDFKIGNIFYFYGNFGLNIAVDFGIPIKIWSPQKTQAPIDKMKNFSFMIGLAYRFK